MQHRSGGPIDEPQPAGQPLVGQPDLVGGVHLPGLVGLLRARGAGLRIGGLGQTDRLVGEQALDGADGGQVVEAQAGQPAANERRAPAGVFGAQVEDGSPEGVGYGRRAPAAAVVGGTIGLGGADQVTNRPHRQVEVEGDLLGGLALPCAAANRLAYRERGGSWHGSWP